MSDRSRRLIGGLYGLALGGVYSLMAGTINWLVLHDVPLRVDWLEVLGGAGGAALLGLGLGGLTAWPEAFVPGVIYGALAISFGGTAYALATFEVSFQLTIALLLTLLSRAAIGALITVPLRALVHWHEEIEQAPPEAAALRIWLPLGAVALGLFFGSLSQMPPEAKAAVRQTNRIMQNALQAHTADEMPPSLNRVPDFKARAGASYQLEQRLVEYSFERLYRVSVYFDNGYVVDCLFPPRGSPACEEGESPAS